MDTVIRKALRRPTAADVAYIIKSSADLKNMDLSKEEVGFVKKQHRLKSKVIVINRYKYQIFIIYSDLAGNKNAKLEYLRKQGAILQEMANKSKIERIVCIPVNSSKDELFAFVEGALLSNYQFLKYKADAGKTKTSLNQFEVYSDEVEDDELEELRVITEAVYNARDFVNEPVGYLTAPKFAEEMQALSKEAGLKVEVFNKKKIESLKMGGLLAVNRGSIDPPTFTIMEWKPKGAVNNKPMVLVGKGVVYDTGGLSLKPSNAMDTMKCDMAGGAAVAGAMYAIAKAELPLYVIGLVPATDNRPDGNAYTPGDVIIMHDGSTVEVLNTDAEGRMLLADALSYAKKYDPELVIDVATLTGAAARAIGPRALVGMQAKSEKEFELLERAGDAVHERIVEFPLWDDYKEQLTSDIADLKNIGGINAGAITAGKFLEHFTDYPYIHLDIAGPAFISKKDTYRTSGGTAVGVRLLFEFMKRKSDV